MAFSILNMDFSDRLKQRMQAVGLNAADLAAKVGVSKGAVTHWTNGTNQANGARLIRLAEILECDPTWLATGGQATLYKLGSGRTVIAFTEDEAPQDHIDIPAFIRRDPNDANVEPALQPTRKAKEYPLISWIAAGERAESPDNHYPGDGEEMLASTENAGAHGYWLKVRGKSMTSDTPPSFPEGTPILVRPEGFELVSGKFYIAKHKDGETTFKQYVRDAGTAYLAPLNPAFKSVEMDDEWRIIGRVVDAKITGL